MVTGRRKLCLQGAFNTSEEKTEPPPPSLRILSLPHKDERQTRDGAAEPLWPGSENLRGSKRSNYHVFMECQLSLTAAGRILSDSAALQRRRKGAGFLCLLQSCCGGGSSLRPPGRHQGSNPRLQDVDGGLQISAGAPTAVVRRSWRCSVPGRNEIVSPLVNEEKLHSRHAVGCPAPSTATGPWCSLRADWMAAPHPGTGQRRRSSTETCDVP